MKSRKNAENDRRSYHSPMKIRAVLFDLDETLIEEEASNDQAAYATCKFAAERLGVDLDRDAMFRAMREQSRELWLGGPMIDYCMNIGISPREGLWGSFSSNDSGAARLREWIPEYRILTWLGALQRVVIDGRLQAAELRSLAAELADKFMTDRRTRHIVFPETERVMRELQPHYRFALITNGATDIQQEKIDGSRLGPFFQSILISGSFGAGKPHPEIFRSALSKLGLEPAEAVMIGDSPSRDIDGAGVLGIRTVWMNRLRKPLSDRYRAPDFELPDLNDLPSLLANLT
jgi:putative hydrolase of the HAD superfamily